MNTIVMEGLELVPEVQESELRLLLEDLTDAAGLEGMELAVTFVDDDHMTALNQNWCEKEGPTDILSFSALEGERMPGTEHLLGDLVISVDTAKRQAQEYGHRYIDEIAVLFAHGILHLMGYDHEKNAQEARLQAECEMGMLDVAGIRPELALCARNFQ